MCIFGGYDGFFVMAGFILPAALILRSIRGGKNDQADGQTANWVCPNDRCRRRNTAKSIFCGRCGARRGTTTGEGGA